MTEEAQFYVNDNLSNEALDKGADAYMMKPVTIDELEDSINTALDKRRI